MTPTVLNALEPSLNIANVNEAELTTATGTANTYEVTATAQNTKDTFTVKRLATGVVEHKCVSPGGKGCPGQTASANSW